MKVILATLLLAASVCAASAFPIVEYHNASGWHVPQEDGSLKWMSEDEFISFSSVFNSDRSSSDVIFHLFTRDNPKTPETLVTDDVAILKQSKFDKSRPTHIIIHGWMNKADSDLCYDIRDSLLAIGSYNVICVDWSYKAKNLNYAAAVLRVPGIGQKVAKMIDFLHKEDDMSFDTLHVDGHSLGAHVAGFAGKNVKYGRIGQIVGLDPALPLFRFDNPAGRLNQNDARYVETIQTNGGLLGFLEPIGHGTFYPNGGKSQPGCILDLAGSCSHGRSYKYYAEAIRENNFPSIKCNDYKNAIKKECGSMYSAVRMGAITNFINAKGDFYVPVNKKTPFGMGN